MFGGAPGEEQACLLHFCGNRRTDNRWGRGCREKLPPPHTYTQTPASAYPVGKHWGGNRVAIQDLMKLSKDSLPLQGEAARQTESQNC